MIGLVSARIDNDKKTLTLVMTLKSPTASKSGKTDVVASTRGNQPAGVSVDGRQVIVGVNAYLRK